MVLRFSLSDWFHHRSGVVPFAGQLPPWVPTSPVPVCLDLLWLCPGLASTFCTVCPVSLVLRLNLGIFFRPCLWVPVWLLKLSCSWHLWFLDLSWLTKLVFSELLSFSAPLLSWSRRWLGPFCVVRARAKLELTFFVKLTWLPELEYLQWAVGEYVQVFSVLTSCVSSLCAVSFDLFPHGWYQLLSWSLCP